MPKALAQMCSFLSFLGCELSISPCELAETYTPSVQVGMGESRFVSIDDGDLVPFHYGPQGGQHVYGSIRTQGFAPGFALVFGGVRDGVDINYSLYASDTEIGWGGGEGIALSGTAEDGESFGSLVFVEFEELFLDEQGKDADWEDFDYYETETPAILEVEITDGCGTTASDSREVLLYAYE